MMRRTDTTIISRIPVRIIWIRIHGSSARIRSTTRCQFSSEYTGPMIPFPFRFLLCHPNFQVCILFLQSSICPLILWRPFKPVCLHMPIVGSGDLYNSVSPAVLLCILNLSSYVRSALPGNLSGFRHRQSRGWSRPRLHFAVHKAVSTLSAPSTSSLSIHSSNTGIAFSVNHSTMHSPGCLPSIRSIPLKL